MVDELDLDLETACARLQTIVQDFLDKAERLAYATGQPTDLKLKDPDTNQPLKPLKKKWERDMAKAYQKVLTDAATQLQEVMKISETAPQLKTEMDKVCDGLEQKVSIMENIYSPLPATQARLFQRESIEPIPCGFPIRTSNICQLRKDFWGKGADGIAVSRHEAKGNPKNYVEHYISSPGDIAMLFWDAAEQIIDKLGFNTVKLQFIFAAHAMKQDEPWKSSFTLKGRDVIKELGWDKRTDLTLAEKLSAVANIAYVLESLLVKAAWEEGPHRKGGVRISVETSRMWNMTIRVTGQANLLEGKIDQPDEVYITVQPGLWTKGFLNKAGWHTREALYQFGYVAQQVLQIDPYHNELALRLAIHLTTESRIHDSGKYRVRTLLESAIPIPEIETARSNFRKSYDLKQRWDNALKLLKNLGWLIEFDESYPELLRPGSSARKPKGYLDQLLEAKITIKPPAPIPELLSNTVEPKKPPIRLKPAAKQPLTGDQIRKAREAKGWTQRKLAGTLGVTQPHIVSWEKGKRTPSPDAEAKIRKILDIQD